MVLPSVVVGVEGVPPLDALQLPALAGVLSMIR